MDNRRRWLGSQPIIDSQHCEDKVVYLVNTWYMLGAWLSPFFNLILTSLWVVLFISETVEGQQIIGLPGTKR